MDTGRMRNGGGPERGRPQAARGGRLAAAVFAELERLGDLLARPGGLQPFALVAVDGRLVAANRPLFELLGCDESELLGSCWARVMPAWATGTHPDGSYQFDACLLPPLRDDLQAPVSAHAWVYPVVDADGVVAHTLLLASCPSAHC